MSIYESLNVRPVINAAATLTRLGGSLMPPEVLAAMTEASKHFVDLDILQQRVGERLAALTRNEAAYVCSGAAAGLMLSAAVCVTRDDESLVHRFPDLTGLRDEVIVQRGQRNTFDYAIRQIGLRIIEIGGDEGTSQDDLRAAITPKTAAVFWFQGDMTTTRDLPLPQVIEVAKQHQVPVVVDAAAQLPPVENLWAYTQMGADLAVFSGGKDLRGPQSSGMILGRKDLIEACRMHGNPNQTVGRPMKVGKEEMLGLLAAVERYLKLDHAARAQECEQIVADWCDGLKDVAGIRARRAFPNEAGQPLAWCRVEIDANELGLTRQDMIDQLAAGDPPIMVDKSDPRAIYLNPMTLEDGEAQIVLTRLLDITSATH